MTTGSKTFSLLNEAHFFISKSAYVKLKIWTERKIVLTFLLILLWNILSELKECKANSLLQSKDINIGKCAVKGETPPDAAPAGAEFWRTKELLLLTQTFMSTHITERAVCVVLYFSTDHILFGRKDSFAVEFRFWCSLITLFVSSISKSNSFYCKHTSFERHAPIEMPPPWPKEINTGAR